MNYGVDSRRDIPMNTAQNVVVFDDADMIRECVTMLCRDRLPKIPVENVTEASERASEIDRFCWEAFALQGKIFPYSVLLEKCRALLARTAYAPLMAISADDLANEISSPAGGW